MVASPALLTHHTVNKRVHTALAFHFIHRQVFFIPLISAYGVSVHPLVTGRSGQSFFTLLQRHYAAYTDP
jgi:hypothetical protein